MIKVETKAGTLYQSAKLAVFSWLVHGFGTRHVLLKDYLSHFEKGHAIYANTKQRHGNKVHVITDNLSGEVVEGDAFITSDNDVACYVRTADCLPILLCDSEKRIVAAVHAGWKGIVCDVIGRSISQMTQIFGTLPKNIIAAIGPSICANCYYVGEDVVKQFKERGLSESLWHCDNKAKVFLMDLKGAGIELLKRAGIQKNNMDSIQLCTSCSCTDFISYRRDSSEESRQINFILCRTGLLQS